MLPVIGTAVAAVGAAARVRRRGRRVVAASSNRISIRVTRVVSEIRVRSQRFIVVEVSICIRRCERSCCTSVSICNRSRRDQEIELHGKRRECCQDVSRRSSRSESRSVRRGAERNEDEGAIHEIMSQVDIVDDALILNHCLLLVSFSIVVSTVMSVTMGCNR